MKNNEQYLTSPYSKKSQYLIDNACHTVEEVVTVNGKKIQYNKYVFNDGTDVVECESILDTEKDFLAIQANYVSDTEYADELMPDNTDYPGEWLPYRSTNRY